MDEQIRIRPNRRARRLKLKVLPDASVELVVPPGVGERAARAFIAEQREWLARTRARMRAERAADPHAGPYPATLALRALQTDVAVTWRFDAPRDASRWHAGGLAVSLARRAPDAARPVLVEALKRHARARLEPRLLEWAAAAGLQPGRIGWRHQKTRWGSCAASGNISLNIRLLFLPAALVDYVLVHELVHLEHRNHSPAFHARVDAILPDAGARRRLLRGAGRYVPGWML